MGQSKNNHEHSFLFTYASWALGDLPTILSSGSFCYALWIIFKVFCLSQFEFYFYF